MKTFYWSRIPGKFVNTETGVMPSLPIGIGPLFSGSIREWYETLYGTIVLISSKLGSEIAELKASADMACLLQASILFMPAKNQNANCLGKINNKQLVLDNSLAKNQIMISLISSEKFMIEMVD
jgi:hypothetical protein